MLKINCHPEFSSGSHEMLKQVQHDNQGGRSMVEMLGVLAIVGILSIGGVGGYTTAMKKHKANELLNEASKRAVVLSMKIAAGQPIDNNSLDEFRSNQVGSATFSEVKTGAKTFGLTLTGVDESVLSQMKAMLGSDGVMKIAENCDASTNVCSATLHFNKDLKPGNIDTTDNGQQEGGEGEGTTSDEPALLDNTEWYQGPCQDGYALVSGPYDGCARNLEEAKELCVSSLGYFDTNLTSATIVEGPLDDTPSKAGKKYFSCTSG